MVILLFWGICIHINMRIRNPNPMAAFQSAPLKMLPGRTCRSVRYLMPLSEITKISTLLLKWVVWHEHILTDFSENVRLYDCFPRKRILVNVHCESRYLLAYVGRHRLRNGMSAKGINKEKSWEKFWEK